MNWQLFLTISIVAEVIGRLIQRSLLKDDKSDPIAYAIVSQILAGIFIGIFAVFNGFSFPPLNIVMFNFLLMPVLFGVANMLIFTSLKQTEASIFTVLFSTRALWIVIGALMLFGEPFSGGQLLGALLLFMSVIMVTWKKEKIKLQKGEILALLAAIFFACAILNDSYIARFSDVASYTSISFVFTGIFIWLVNAKKSKAVVNLVTSEKNWKIAMLSAIYVTAAATYLYAYQVGKNAAQIGAIYQLSTILTILCAIVILNERSSIKIKILAGILSVIGVILVA